MKNKVIIIEKIFPLYRKAIFDLVSKKVDLIVLHGKNYSGIKSISTEYSKSIPSFQYAKRDTALLLFPIQKIIKYKPHVVIFDLALGILNVPIILLFCKLMKVKFVFWSHGYNRKTGFNPKSRLADKYRLFLLKAADANIVYSDFDKQVLAKFLNNKKIFVAQNTIDTATFSKIRAELENEGKENIKKRLKINHEFNIIFISRMLAAKQPELLISIYEILKIKYGLIVGIHFVGDGEMLSIIKREVEIKEYDLDFYFHGSIHDPVLNGALLYVSDIMVIPGAIGLSINHSFCFDCPVISFSSNNGIPAHGPEVEFLIHTKTGFWVKEHSALAMAYEINSLLKNEELRLEVKKNIRKLVENQLTLDKMLSGVIECINYVQSY